jgi:uncharacterized membrane protein YbaN (DUF454 family)
MRSSLRNLFLTSIGFLALALGIAGLFLPLLPTTPFVLLAAWCFAKASPRFHAWLIHHPIFGRIISDWQATGSIPRSAKIFAVVAIVFSLASVWTLVPLLAVQIGLTVMLLAVTLFILSRPTSRR